MDVSSVVLKGKKLFSLKEYDNNIVITSGYIPSFSHFLIL